ncbi:DUF2460 domain-containing protein [Sphingomonas lycopersici]|uniref:DUF2460 domain-containing protein n=1 Tax=Sphingomonas lycopersici TaxID=2951807 RepID=A0AA41ZAU0_9SPHN|nr:DUF2460 domain-containing protein [Sphingomonas lycopersici]MCW6536650.1 DUF2460 domain-containing protein [Sphingomonas lycopersici]
MGYWLSRERRHQAAGVIQRFDARFWTVNFPRPMMAAVTTIAPDALRVDCVFYRADDLAGLIWEAEDRWDHPLLRYETARDFRDCRLSFRWRSGGVRALDAVNGPVLTIEGRDRNGDPRTWYVRLWNYAEGMPEDALISIDFASVVGGFMLPAEADTVWAGDVDRMFVSLVPRDYSGADALLAAPAEGWAEMSAIRCEGAGAVIAIGDVIVPEHGIGIAGGYDDSYNLTPARLLRNALQLGYRGAIVHYVGMSHYFRLEANSGGLYVSLAGGALNAACAAWHRDCAARARELGYDIIWSLSYELFDRHCWGDWKQRAADGAPALTGWSPPSTLLSPTHAGAMNYLQAVARAFVAIGVEAGLAAHFQVGKPWWWVMPDGRPCLYDASAVAAFAPVPIATIAGAKSPAEIATLDTAGAALAASTAVLVAAARAVAADCRTYLLAYLPTVLVAAAPEAKRVNLPIGWASPAFDVLQLEDYDWVTAGDTASSRAGATAAAARLGYPPGRQDYFAGFVRDAADATPHWRQIAAAADAARRRGVARAYFWALPQVMRDGLVHWDEEEPVIAFDDVLFPLALGREAEVAPEFSTTIVASAGGRETRNVAWAGARTRYDAGPGVRSEQDIRVRLDFFRARMGPARGFRLRDPFDADAADVAIGTGDGATRRFALVKHYGATVRRITRPVAGSVAVRLGGVATAGFALEQGGHVVFDAAPASGVTITASFAFDVPVRFAEDRLSVTRATFLAGAAPSVPLIEIRED